MPPALRHSALPAIAELALRAPGQSGLEGRAPRRLAPPRTDSPRSEKSGLEGRAPRPFAPPRTDSPPLHPLPPPLFTAPRAACRD